MDGWMCYAFPVRYTVCPGSFSCGVALCEFPSVIHLRVLQSCAHSLPVHKHCTEATSSIHTCISSVLVRALMFGRFLPVPPFPFTLPSMVPLRHPRSWLWLLLKGQIPSCPPLGSCNTRGIAAVVS